VPRALITGIAGFAGGHLAEHLLASGDEVFGLTRAEDPPAALAAAGLGERIPLVHADVTDADAVQAALERATPERIYHLAGFSSPRLSYEDPLGCYRTNILGTAALLEAVRRSGARPRVLVVSSAEIYGNAGPGPIAEEAPLRPLTPYGASKAGCEAISHAAVAAFGIPAVIARPFNHIGPRQAAAFAAPSFAKQIAEAEVGRGPHEIRVGNLTPIRDLSDVRDVVRAYRLLAEGGLPGEAYNIGSGQGVSVRALLDRLVALARVPLRVVEDAARFKPADIPCLVSNPARLVALTGFKPTRPLEETLAIIVEDWRRRVGSSTAS
jgi:GDP-4-dehydro-6-deoxy-D-mannose reductase